MQGTGLILKIIQDGFVILCTSVEKKKTNLAGGYLLLLWQVIWLALLGFAEMKVQHITLSVYCNPVGCKILQTYFQCPPKLSRVEPKGKNQTLPPKEFSSTNELRHQVTI